MDELTLKDFKEAVDTAINGQITNIAPFGVSGDDIVLSGTRSNGRVSLVSVRKYCDSIELLITDVNGVFLTYQKYYIPFGVEYIANKFYEIWHEMKEFIKRDMKQEIKEVIAENAEKSIGFAILEAAFSKEVAHE